MAWTQQRKNGYRGRYRDLQGVSKTVPGRFKLKRQALKAAQDEEAKLRAGTWLDPDAGKVTFSEYFEQHWITSRLNEDNTIAAYWSAYNTELQRAFGETQLRRISTASVQNWVTDMVGREVNPATIRKKFAVLSVALGGARGRSAVRDKIISESPCLGVELPHLAKRKVQIYQPAEFERLFTALPEWWQVQVTVQSETGFRWGELMGLEVADLAAGILTAHRTITEVGKKYSDNGTRFKVKLRLKPGRSNAVEERPILLSAALSTAVHTLIEERELQLHDRLFSMPQSTPDGLIVRRTQAWPQGEPVSRNYFRNSVWIPAIERAKIPYRRPHDVRATNISWLLAGGADLATVMDRAGHTQIRTTQVYTTALADAQQRAVAALARVRRGDSHA